MAWRTFVRERLTSAVAQEYFMDQAVLQFASAAARDAAIPLSARRGGMLAYTADVFTYWTWSAAAARWDFLAVADGGWTLCTVNGGWTGTASHLPKVRRFGASRIGMSGWFTNGGPYSANATQTPLTLPGFAWPKTDRVVPVIMPGDGRATATITPAGAFRLDWSSHTFAAGTTHFLDHITYDFLDTGGA